MPQGERHQVEGSSMLCEGLGRPCCLLSLSTSRRCSEAWPCVAETFPSALQHAPHGAGAPCSMRSAMPAWRLCKRDSWAGAP